MRKFNFLFVVLFGVIVSINVFFSLNLMAEDATPFGINEATQRAKDKALDERENKNMCRSNYIKLGESRNKLQSACSKARKSTGPQDCMQEALECSDVLAQSPAEKSSFFANPNIGDSDLKCQEQTSKDLKQEIKDAEKKMKENKEEIAKLDKDKKKEDEEIQKEIREAQKEITKLDREFKKSQTDTKKEEIEKTQKSNADLAEAQSKIREINQSIINLRGKMTEALNKRNFALIRHRKDKIYINCIKSVDGLPGEKRGASLQFIGEKRAKRQIEINNCIQEQSAVAKAEIAGIDSEINSIRGQIDSSEASLASSEQLIESSRQALREAEMVAKKENNEAAQHYYEQRNQLLKQIQDASSKQLQSAGEYKMKVVQLTLEQNQAANKLAMLESKERSAGTATNSEVVEAASNFHTQYVAFVDGECCEGQNEKTFPVCKGKKNGTARSISSVMEVDPIMSGGPDSAK